MPILDYAVTTPRVNIGAFVAPEPLAFLHTCPRLSLVVETLGPGGTRASAYHLTTSQVIDTLKPVLSEGVVRSFVLPSCDFLEYQPVGFSVIVPASAAGVRLVITREPDAARYREKGRRANV